MTDSTSDNDTRVAATDGDRAAAPTAAGDDTQAAVGAPPRQGAPDLEQEGEIAADYLEGLLDIADVDGDIDLDVEGDRAMVSIVGGGLSHLVGENGNVLDALQELTRLAVLRETGERSRLMLDIAGYRAAKRDELSAVGRKAAEEARANGSPVRLSAMTPFERKIVHDAVAAAGLSSESEGVEPERYVVVLPQ